MSQVTDLPTEPQPLRRNPSRVSSSSAARKAVEEDTPEKQIRKRQNPRPLRPRKQRTEVPGTADVGEDIPRDLVLTTEDQVRRETDLAGVLSKKVYSIVL